MRKIFVQHRQLTFMSLLLCVLVIVGLFFTVSAQDAVNLEPYSEAIADFRATCNETNINEVCVDGAVQSLDSVDDFVTSDDAWSIVSASFQANPAEALSGPVELFVFGDTVVTPDMVDTETVTCVVTNKGELTLDIVATNQSGSQIITTFDPEARVVAAGRDVAKDWFLVRPDSGTIGWIAARDISIDCDPMDLAVVESGDLSLFFSSALQNLVLETNNANDPAGLLVQSPESDTAVLQVNNTPLFVDGGVLVTSDDLLTITGVSGETRVGVGADAVTITADTQAVVEPDGTLTITEVSEPTARALYNSIVLGQPATGPFVDGLAIRSTKTSVDLGDFTRVDLTFRGDAATCETAAPAPGAVTVLADTPEGLPDIFKAAYLTATLDLFEELSGTGTFASFQVFNERSIDVLDFLEPLDLLRIEALYQQETTQLQNSPIPDISAFDAALTSAISQYKILAGEDLGEQIVVLLTSGSGDLDSLEVALTEAENRGVRLVAVGLGRDADPAFLEAIATTPDDVYVAGTPAELTAIMKTLGSSLTEPLAARDFEISYTVSDSYEIVNALGATRDVNTITWERTTVYNNERLTFPVTVRATTATTDPVGTIDVDYLACATGRNRIGADGIAAPTLVVTDDPATSAANVALPDSLDANTTYMAAIDRLEEQVVTLNVEAGQLVSVATSDQRLSVYLSDQAGVLLPRYSLQNTELLDDEDQISVFYVEQPSLVHVVNTGQPLEEFELRVSTQLASLLEGTLVADGSRLEGTQPRSQGTVFALNNANPGDTFTFRIQSSSTFFPTEVEVFSTVDGSRALEIVRQFNRNDSGEAVKLVELQGEGPYQVFVKTQGDYLIKLEGGDTVTEDRGELQIGLAESYDELTDQQQVYSYALNNPVDQIVAVNHSLLGDGGFVNRLTVLDANNQQIPVFSRFEVNRFRVASYDLPAGDYRVLVETDTNYRILTGIGDVRERLKGVLGIDETQQDFFPPEAPFGIYNLVEGTDKPLFDGDLVSLVVVDDEIEAYLENAIGARSGQLLSLDNTRVHELQGDGPYRLVLVGDPSRSGSVNYTVTRGDLLTNEKGALVVGPVTRDSSRSAEFIYYDLVPEVGKRLVAGDTVTLRVANQGNSDFFTSSRLLDAKGEPVSSSSDYQSQDPRTGIIRVYELSGTPPYRLELPNQGAYSVNIDIGDTLNLRGRPIEIDEELVNRTQRGPQIVQHPLRGQPGDVVTIRLSENDTNPDFDLTNATTRFFLVDDDFRETVFELNDVPDGVAPEEAYIIEFDTEGQYAITTEEGNQLAVDVGGFFLGDSEFYEVDRDIFGPGPYLIRRELELTAGQVISVNVLGAGFNLFDPDGVRVEPQVEHFDYDDQRRFDGRTIVYRVRESGRYRIFQRDIDGEHRLRIQDGNTLFVDKGNAFVDVPETDQLERNKRFATYSVEAEEGVLVGVRVDMPFFERTRNGLDEFKLTLTNAEGQSLPYISEIDEDGLLARVFLTEGIGPYILTLEPQRPGDQKSSFQDHEEYNLLIQADSLDAFFSGGDTLLPFRTPLEVEVGDQPRLMRYQLDDDIQEGDQFTIQIDRSPSQDETFGTSTDVNGIKFESDAGVSPSQGVSVASFTAQGSAPYTFEMQITGEYTIRLDEGDLLTADFGALVVNPQNPPVELDDNGNEIPFEPVTFSNRLASPQLFASYTISGEAGDIVTVQLSEQNQPLFADLFTAEGQFAEAIERLTGTTSSTLVFVLEDNRPHRLVFSASDTVNHTITVTEGNLVIGDFGVLVKNPNELPTTTNEQGEVEVAEPEIVEGDLEDPQRYATFTVEGEPGETISVLVNQPTAQQPADTTLLNALGDRIEPTALETDRTSYFVTYDLVGNGPYRLSFEPTRPFEVQLRAGDVLRSEEGPIPFGNLEEPYTNELPEPARVARHTLDTTSGEVITVQIENANRLVPMKLFDTNGSEVRPLFTDFQGNRNNVSVYLLTGPAPHTLEFPADGEYTASIATANLIRVDQGLVTFNETIEGEIEDPARSSNYVIAGKRDQFVTIEIRDTGQPVVGELRDANGRLWLPVEQINRNGRLLGVYLLGGPPPYDVTFRTTRNYDLVVSDDNQLISPETPVVVFGETVRGTLETPLVTAVYRVEANPGETISVAANSLGRPVLPILRNADNLEIIRRELVEKQGTAYNVYTLTGSGPYTLSFETEGSYSLEVNQGNILSLDQGEIVFDERQTQFVQSPAERISYTINAEAGSRISVTAQIGGRPAEEVLLADGSGEEIDADVVLDKNANRYLIYTLNGEGPYVLTLETGQNQYNLTVNPGNVLQAEKGPIRFGNTISDLLTEPEEVATYFIDAQPGGLISLELVDLGLASAQLEMRDANDSILQPVSRAQVSSSSYTLYALYGPPPYTVSFAPSSRYNLTLERGNFAEQEAGTITFNTPVTDQLRAPLQTAIYDVNTEADQIISVQLTNQGVGDYITGTLLDAEGNAIEPITEVFIGTRTAVQVYDLMGTTPTYRYRFDSNQRYEIIVRRGDITDTELPDFTP